VKDAAPELPVMAVGPVWEAAIESARPRRDYGARSGDDRYIIYTGGTTGMPKGVMWRQEDLFFAGLQGGRPGGDPVTEPSEVVAHASDPDNAMNLLPAAPFIHGAAQLGGWISIFTGGKVVLQPGRSFDARRVCELIGEENVTTITLVGDAMARPLAEALAEKTYDCASLVAIASAGAILSPAVRDRLQELLPETLILNNFGSTETGHQGSAFPGSETGADGRPSFAMDKLSLVLDDDLRPIEPGSGKLGRLARSGRVPLGYYKDEAKTKERFVTLDGVRYVLPGDMATVEADGRITVYGRGSNCINTGGEKVFPEEVEEALKAHPDVFDALVVGVADDKWMQRVAAVVQPRAGATPTLAELQAHCRDRIAGYKVPRQLALVSEVARYPSGKPDYAWARKIAEEKSS
jgi:acyl-CoA synthetase (AMP-forming)/AMP-acid ligase II